MTKIELTIEALRLACIDSSRSSDDVVERAAKYLDFLLADYVEEFPEEKAA